MQRLSIGGTNSDAAFFGGQPCRDAVVPSSHQGVHDGPEGHDASGAGAVLAAFVERAAGGDGDAWAELVRLYAPRIFAMARSRLGGREIAEDVVQSVFTTAAEQLLADRRAGGGRGYKECGRFEPWLFRITMNRVRDEARRRRRRRPLSTMDRLETHAAPPIELPHGEEPDSELLGLRRAMERLALPDREVVELRHHAQMSFRDIAELLGQPVGTVLARHHRALRKLRMLIEVPPDASREERS